MKRKYLDQAKIPHISRPDKWYGDTIAHKKWKKQRNKYGFDIRDTFSMDITFYCWLLEHLMMYKEVTDVNLDECQIQYNDQELTLSECIDRMIEGCRIALSNWEYGYDSELKAKVDDVIKIWAVTIHAIWW